MEGYLSEIIRNNKGVTSLKIKTKDINQELMDKICRKNWQDIIFVFNDLEDEQEHLKKEKELDNEELQKRGII
jgi:hypothetical protein